MKPTYSLVFITLLFWGAACANKDHVEDETDSTIKQTPKILSADTFETGKIIHAFCKADTSQSYALYLPANDKKKAAIVYFFDPHGSGSFPLSKYTALANEFNFILIGSNNSKNGNNWPTNEYIWTTLFNDSHERLQINNSRIYVCGFSGGAKVATYTALHHPEIKGVIANGAGLPEITSTGNFQFSFTAVAGEGDLNMTDLVAINNKLDETQTKHRIIFFNGIHEWAPVNTMRTAFAGWQLDAMKEKTISPDEQFINKYIAGSKERIAEYANKKNYINAERECKLSVNMLEGLTNDVIWFIKKEADLKKDPAYQKQFQETQSLLTTESNIKNTYNEQFQSGDKNYWIKTINEVKIKSKAVTAEGAMYQRLHAYLSLAFYSISNQLINASQNDDARHFVDLYKLSDPANSEAWYLSAVLYARNKDAKATENDLLKSISLGFSDKNRLMQQPEFSALGAQINLTGIAGKIK